jgi:hypothetical protein
MVPPVQNVSCRSAVNERKEALARWQKGRQMPLRERPEIGVAQCRKLLLWKLMLRKLL